MTDARRMLLPFFLAEAPSPWWQPAVGSVVAGVPLAVVGWYLAKISKRAERADHRQDKAEEESAQERINDRDSRDTFAEQRNRDYGQLRTEFETYRRESDERMRVIEGRLMRVGGAYSELHTVTMILQQGWRTMKARLKRTDPTYDEKEFPDFEVSADFAPSKILAELTRPISVTVITNPKKLGESTSIITES